MGSLLANVLAVSLGVVMSPLAVIAVVAVLFSEQARANSIAYLTGWILGSVFSVSAAYGVLTVLEVHERRDPPVWVPLTHILVGGVLLAGAWFVLTRGRQHLRAMAHASTAHEVGAAAPQLPTMLQSVTHFNPARSALLGFALFVLNPVDVSCAIAAALDIRLSSVTTAEQLIVATVFILVGASSVAIPVAILLIRRENALRPLERIRTWIATNTKLLNVGLLILIAIMQLNKGIQGI